MKKVAATFAISIIILVFSEGLMAATQWELSSDRMGIRVFNQEREKSPFNLVKAQMDIKVGLDDLAQVMRDIPAYSEWMFGCVKSDVIDRVDEHNFTLYYVHETPWPFNYRDVVLSIKTEDGLNDGWFNVDMVAIDNPYTVDEDYVRMAEMVGKWHFEAINESVSRITFTLVVDPAGDVPVMFVNSGNETVVYESFLGLKRKALGEHFDKEAEKYSIETFDSL